MIPSRIIQYKYSSLSGRFPSRKNNRSHIFESSLEKDFMILLEFDSNVIKYTEQPVKINYIDKGKGRNYYPDFLVTHKSDAIDSNKNEEVLYEIKYSDFLEKHKTDLKSKFNAAKEYAKSKGWDFRIVTDHEIRTNYLENAKFLLKYRDYNTYQLCDFDLLIDSLNKLNHTTPEELILIIARDRNKQAELIYLLWHMIANQYILCDLTTKLTMDSEIWPSLIL